MMEIALDINPYAQRGVLLDDRGNCISHYDGQLSHQCQKWLRANLAAGASRS